MAVDNPKNIGNSMRVKILPVSFALLEDLLKGNLKKARTEGLPDKFRIIRAHDYRRFGTALDLIVESEEFEEVKRGEMIPEMKVLYTIEVEAPI